MKTFAAIGLTAVSLLGLATAYLWSEIFLSSAGGRSQVVEVRVEQGDSLATAARKLREQQAIRSDRLFVLWARLRGLDKRIQHGLYRIEPREAPNEILERLVTGKGVFYTVTIPEGLTVRDIADLLARMEIADRDKFLAEAANPELLQRVGLQERSVEGYLFPSTYNFVPQTPEREIILTMVDHFRKVAQPLLAQRDDSLALSPHEIITLASMIEKETGIESERPLVSAVFHNRLKRQMPMQSDPTVIYGLQNFDGNLTRKDLRHPSPYNTYRIAALPPGPICNPGLASIQAALNPADVSYLYFVSRNDGTHVFSDTLEQHNKAVQRYQPVKQAAVPRAKAARRR